MYINIYVYVYISPENQAQHPASPTPGSTAGVERMKERFLKVKEELKTMKDASSKKERYILTCIYIHQNIYINIYTYTYKYTYEYVYIYNIHIRIKYLYKYILYIYVCIYVYIYEYLLNN
jgi:hypothetical protein